MITLKRLRWSNVFSYGADNELILNDEVLTQIIGPNGQGKSSIPLIIEEAVFNKNSKGIKKADIPNRYINDGYWINLELDKDENEYEIDVTRNKVKVVVKLYENGSDISSHTATNTYKTIQEIIGLDFKTFSQLVYQNTNASLQFLTATDTNRKKFLIDLLHLEEYLELFDVFKEAATEVRSKTTGVASTIMTIEKWLVDNKLTNTSILPMLKLEINTEEEEKQIRHLSTEITNISSKNKKISQNNNYKQSLERIDLNAIQNIKVDKLESYDALQSELGGHDNTIIVAKRLLHKFDTIKDICPTCEQVVDEAFKIAFITEEQKKIDAATLASKLLRQRIEVIKENNSLYRYREKTQNEWAQLYRSIDPNLPAHPLDQRDLQNKLDILQRDVRRAKESLEETAAENNRRTKHNTRIQVIQEQTDKFIEELNKAQKVLDDEQELLSNLEILKKAFSPNGLLAYEIENLVKDLEDLTNTYLAELSDGRFTLEFVVTNDKLNVQITDNGNIVDILALSSGELARVNTATLIAIRKLMSSISGSQLNILFLDEVISVLDAQGKEKLVEVLLNEDLNTYIISHQWTHPLLAKLEVVKDGNISSLEK